MRIGVMFRCSTPPEVLPGYARLVEELGYDELWLVEDCFYPGAVAPAAVALSVTSRIRVGIGIMPAVLRNPALAAMELSGLARMFPGRLIAGFGHGVAEWMKQVGAFPSSQLAALGETVAAVRALLAGERVDSVGRHVHLRDVRLALPPTAPVPVVTGVRNEKSLRLSGAVADGTLLAEAATPGYAAWARERIDEGRRAAGRTDHHELTAYLLIDPDDPSRSSTRETATVALRAVGPPRGLTPELAGRLAELAATIGDDAALAAALPAEYLDLISISGSPEAWPEQARAFQRAGVDALALVPSIDPETAAAQLRSTASLNSTLRSAR